MKRTTVALAFLVALAWVAVPRAGAADMPTLGPDEPVRVLFLGSSYTYFNNLPAMVEALAEADRGARRIETRMFAPGGSTLQDHWNDDDERAAIRTGEFDFVVLQAQSTFGEVYLVRGRYRVGGHDLFDEYATRLVAEVRRAGAIPVLYMHWRRRDAPRRDRTAIGSVFRNVAHRTGARLAPVGEVFELVRERRPELELYSDDGSHPSPAGTLLAAQVIYRTITGRRTPGTPTTLKGPAIDYEAERPRPDEIVELVRVSADDARAIRAAAEDVCDKEEKATYEEPPGVPPIADLPTVPPGEPIDAVQLAGVWRGAIDVYPVPGTLELRLEREAEDGWTARARITFEGGVPDDIVPAIEQIEVTSTGLSFTDVQGPNGGRVVYRGAFTGAALEGTAEIFVDAAPIYGIGGWKVEKTGKPEKSAEPGEPTKTEKPTEIEKPTETENEKMNRVN